MQISLTLSLTDKNLSQIFLRHFIFCQFVGLFSFHLFLVLQKRNWFSDNVPWIAIYRQTDPVKICTKLLASCLINRQALRSCHLFWNFLLQNSLEQQGTYPSCGKNLATVVIFSSYRQSVATLQLPTILLQYTVYSRKIFGLYCMAISQHWQRNIYFKTYQVHV